MKKVRALFVSDVHLGCRHANASAFLEFLRDHQPERLYLVGDFFDGWRLGKRWYWTESYTLILKRLLDLANAGTEIFYTPGNHDEFLRSFIVTLGGVEISDEFIHTTSDQRRILVIHGDQFDAVVVRAKWLSLAGDIGYNILLSFNRIFNSIRRQLGMTYWPLSIYVKRRVKEMTSAISNFEHMITRYARSKGCEGVVCGHIHNPAIHRQNDVMYYNTGDWVESCTAIVEDDKGRLRLVHSPLHDWTEQPWNASAQEEQTVPLPAPSDLDSLIAPDAEEEEPVALA
ncbi:UDP-2,3-diacylglucosamine hydrolase [Planctomycetes bacterium Pan216]|uniref:UDP-2,3-diacylglucosamine hydrolase n=1 Tax=Kolteria novifilia TaxID=2527975 RepID=A0A518BCC0_9BACT|nr:UDP-2,3-diacylglucosamine hydrolase [Planctomycetes bacterium Pan216]